MHINTSSLTASDDNIFNPIEHNKYNQELDYYLAMSTHKLHIHVALPSQNFRSNCAKHLLHNITLQYKHRHTMFISTLPKPPPPKTPTATLPTLELHTPPTSKPTTLHN